MGFPEYFCRSGQADAHANKEIAGATGLPPHTVKTHTTNLYPKLNVTSRTRAVNAARELSLIPEVSGRTGDLGECTRLGDTNPSESLLP